VIEANQEHGVIASRAPEIPWQNFPWVYCTNSPKIMPAPLAHNMITTMSSVVTATRSSRCGRV